MAGEDEWMSQLKKRERIHAFVLFGPSMDWTIPILVKQDRFHSSTEPNANLFQKHLEIMFYQLSGCPFAQ